MKHLYIKIDIITLVTINYKSSERNALFFFGGNAIDDYS